MVVLPDDFRVAMQQQLGEDWTVFENALQARLPVSLHYNPQKRPGTLMEGDPVAWYPAGRYLPERPSFTHDPYFQAGCYYVQEAGSMFVGHLLQQLPDLPLPAALDLCAAPGGKTSLLLNELPESCTVVANEVIKSRYQTLRDNLAKWGRGNYICTHADSERFAGLQGEFGLVLVDAPCSGEGLFRKTPEAAQEWSPDHVQLCESRQQRILSNALPLLAEGGFLIYSTCTYNERENDRNIDWILQQGGYEVLQPEVPAAWGIQPTRHGYQFYPHRARSEGFYVALLRRHSAAGTQRAKLRPMKFFAKAGKRSHEMLQGWVKTEGRSVLQTPQGKLLALPEHSLPLLQQLSANLPRVDPGCALGVVKGKSLVPEHALAQSVLLSGEVPRCELSREQALAFLRKENYTLPAGQNGWHLMSYDGFGLGWAKRLPRRINNYLPNHLRIRH